MRAEIAHLQKLSIMNTDERVLTQIELLIQALEQRIITAQASLSQVTGDGSGNSA
jgi:hypothetical protein